jgi:Cu+-exporting ATPase
MKHSPLRTTVTTTCFIVNLHCPSCVEAIRDCLSALQPAPEDVNVSIVAHSVIIRHDPSLQVKYINEALDTAGFEIHSIFQDNKAVYQSSSDSDLENATKTWSARLEDTVSRWTTPPQSEDTENIRKKTAHLEQCEQCKIEQGGIRLDSEQESTLDCGKTPLVMTTSHSCIEDDPAETTTPHGTYKANLAISGMTCSSCVSSITQALQSLPIVHTVNVNLLTNSAVVVFGQDGTIEDIVAAVEDSGFEATVESIEEVPEPVLNHPPQSKKHAERWRATFLIDGMTCGSCVGNVTSALEQNAWAEQVSVDLVGSVATVLFRGKEHLAEIKRQIEEVGYTATLDSITAAGTVAETASARTVSIRVDGMFCSHCPENVIRGIKEKFAEGVVIKGPPLSLTAPILTVEYLPNPPELTIRQIFGTIASIHPAFELSVYHPPSIEQRAKAMQMAERRRTLRHLVTCVVVAIPTFILGIVFMSLVPAHSRIRQYLLQPLTGNASRLSWALFILSLPVYVYSAKSFHIRALKEIKAIWRPGSRTPLWQRFTRFGSMNMLMSLGTSIAFFASIAELALAATKKSSGSMENSYFDAVVLLTMFILIGRFLEALSKAKTGEAVASLGALRPDEATLVDSSTGDVKLPTDLLEVGDVVRVHHGTSPPFDGVILDGASSFDESSLTGESRLVKKEVGDYIYSGTLNKGAPVKMKLATISGSSMLDHIIDAVREGQTRRAPVERVADTITAHFVPFVTLVATLTWVVWLVLGTSGAIPKDWRDEEAGGWALWSLRFAIAVFVIACPCGIGLAAPTALFVGGGLAAKHGILVKGGGEAFQEASSLDCIVFDKTGTLTKGGNPAVMAHHFTSSVQDASIVLGIVKALEENSGHPIAQALVQFCNEQTADALPVTSVDEIPGKGLKGSFNIKGDDMGALVGNESLMSDHGVSIPSEAMAMLETWKRRGESVALVALSSTPTQNNWQLASLFAISDPLRPEAAAVVAALKRRGMDVWMLSGDNPTTANAVGAQVGIAASNIIAGVLPDEKAKKIEHLQQTLVKHRRVTPFRLPAFLGKNRHTKRATVAMVGDGINDAPALSAADLSIAIGSGADIALASSSFVLVNSQLATVLTLLDLSRVVFRRVYFNFAWAMVYNLLAMPIAAGVFFPITTGGGMDGRGMQMAGSHVRLDPVWASLAMALSSVSVVCSSLALRSRVPWVGFRVREEGGVTEDDEDVARMV